MSVERSNVLGVRATRQRAAVTALLDDFAEFRSAQDIFDELRRRGTDVSLTTVYRTLQSMATAGLVDTIRTDSGESLFRQCSTKHHHHLVCRNCGTTVEVGGKTVESWMAKIASEHGFSETSHTVEIVGLCAKCGPG